MKVKDIMTKKVVSVGPEAKIAEVAKIMSQNRFHAVPVLEKEEIIGIITEGDFFTRDSKNVFLPSYIDFIESAKITESLAEEKQGKIGKLLDVRARDIMTRECVSILDEMDIKDLLEFFRETKFTTLPVINNENKLIGIITLSDIIGLIKA